jgi:hypothetical protein
VAARRVGIGVTQHPGQFSNPVFAVEWRDIAGRDPAPRLFRDDQVAIGLGRDLRQMGDDQYLPPLRHAGQ